MKQTVFILFHSILQDFLPKAKRENRFIYTFTGKPSIKDVIEAIGIPHTEVGAILLNGSPVTFNVSVLTGAEFEVYPIDYRNTSILPEVQISLPSPIKFVLDVHLGGLARLMRLLGFDTSYETSYSDSEIALLAAKEHRVVLTRDIGLLKQRIISWGYWLRSQDTHEQLKEVLQRYQLLTQAQPFTRCMACNGYIQEVSKKEVIDQLPPKTRQYYHEFFQCTKCHRVYWKGSHYERMQAWLYQLQSEYKD